MIKTFTISLLATLGLCGNGMSRAGNLRNVLLNARTDDDVIDTILMPDRPKRNHILYDEAVDIMK